MTTRAANSASSLAGDCDLLRAARRDPQAFGDFYSRHSLRICAWLRRETHDSAIAFDLTAETFAEALRCVERFRGSTDPEATAWVCGIASNLLKQYRRELRVEDAARRRLGIALRHLDGDQLDEVDERLATEASKPLVQAAFRELPLDQQRALELRAVHELSYRAIAARLSCTEAAARMRVSRAIRTLSNRLRGAEL